MGAKGRGFDAFKQGIEESGDDEATCDGAGDTAGLHIEKFVLTHRAVRGAMGAAHVVIEDFEAWHGVWVGVITQDKVADFLIGVGPGGTGLDFDEAGKNRARLVIEGVEIEEIARGAGSDVILQGALIDFASAFDGVDGEHFAA